MNKSNRIIKIIFIQEPAGGGSFIALYEMLRELDQAEIEPVVICYYKSRYTQELEKLPGCRVMFVEDAVDLTGSQLIFSKNRWLNLILLQYNALKTYFHHDRKLVCYFENVFKTEKPDIIHHNNDISVNRCSIRAAARLGIPQVLYNHGLPVYGYNVVNRIIDRMLLRKIHFHIHLTEAIHAHYYKLFRDSLPDSAIIHSFIDRNVFKPYEPVPSIKREFHIASNEIIITDIGRITYWKGQHVLLEAVHQIKDDLPPFKILLVGSAEKGIGSKDYYRHLQGLVMQYGLEGKVIFTGNRTDVADIINTSDVVVHTAVKPEPQGIVIIEALLCKKLVIASDAAGAAELVKKYGGILFEPGNAGHLSSILLDLFTDKKDAHRLNTWYNDRFELLNNDFASSVKAEQMTGIYRAVVNKVKM